MHFDDRHPEQSQRFVIAAMPGVLRADAVIVVTDAEPHPRRRNLHRIFEQIASGDGDMCGVSPIGFGPGAVLEGRQKAGEMFFVGEDPAF